MSLKSFSLVVCLAFFPAAAHASPVSPLHRLGGLHGTHAMLDLVAESSLASKPIAINDAADLHELASPSVLFTAERTSTPEPGSLFLLGTGVLSLAGLIRKRLA